MSFGFMKRYGKSPNAIARDACDEHILHAFCSCTEDKLTDETETNVVAF